jgi:hypothetical protein
MQEAQRPTSHPAFGAEAQQTCVTYQQAEVKRKATAHVKTRPEPTIFG